MTGQWLSSRRGSPVVLRVELLDGLLNEGGAVAFDFERDVALLPVAKLLHLTTELDFLDRESAELIKNRARFGSHVVHENPTKQIQRQAPSPQQDVVRDELANDGAELDFGVDSGAMRMMRMMMMLLLWVREGG